MPTQHECQNRELVRLYSWPEPFAAERSVKYMCPKCGRIYIGTDHGRQVGTDGVAQEAAA